MAPTDLMFRAFADETRLRLLHALSRAGELCVCDLQKALRLPQPKVSRHLAYLRRAGLVRVRAAGLWKHYSLAEARGGFHKGLVGCLRGCFADSATLKRDLRALKKLEPRKCA